MNENKVVKEVSDSEYEAEKKFEWKISPGDRVEITVFNQTGSSGGGQLNSLLGTSAQSTFMNRTGTEGKLVPPDGKIRLPLIGKIKITGFTEIEAAERLTQEYKKYLRNPYVEVKIQNQKLIVLGEINSPGVVPVTNGTMTLFEALAATGDLTDDAMRTNILILRGDLRHPQVRQVDITDMSKLRLSSLILRPNDIVYVQPRYMKAINKEFIEKGQFFRFLNTIMSPFLTYRAIDQSYNIGITSSTGN
ncbi:polysaccharide export outer membrane protein [Hydrogenimonas sp.]|nr:polysaccharide export outer membrane protein [Hydrogenimonas sp.]